MARSEKILLTTAQKTYLSRMKDLVNKSKSFQALLLKFQQSGKNFVRQTERIETKQFDGRFVEELEKGFDAIQNIIAKPRTFIKEVPEVVDAGLAKKITSQSITHLASHTNLVHSVDSKGNVTPERILTINADVDVQIYENRFVMTLIKKCSLFIEKRFNFIKDRGETRDSDLLLIKSNADVDGALYEVDTRVKVSIPSKDGGNQAKNADLLLRIASLRERCAFFMHSPFMQNDMKGAKEVANPIHQTNLLLKNPDYKKVYKLWQFIDSYVDLGISYEVKETEHNFSDEYFSMIYSLILADVLTLNSNQIKGKEIKPTLSKTTKVTPKVLFSLEDETFHNGKFLYDQFPLAKKKRHNPLALTPEEAAKERKELEEKIKQDHVKKALVNEAIEKQKDKDIAKEAVERQKRLEKENKALRLLEEKVRKKMEQQNAIDEERRKKEADKALKEEERKLQQARVVVASKAKDDRAKDLKSELEPTGKETILPSVTKEEVLPTDKKEAEPKIEIMEKPKEDKAAKPRQRKARKVKDDPSSKKAESSAKKTKKKPAKDKKPESKPLKDEEPKAKKESAVKETKKPRETKPRKEVKGIVLEEKEKIAAPSKDDFAISKPSEVEMPKQPELNESKKTLSAKERKKAVQNLDKFVFIKTLKSPQAKKVKLKGKLK